jgi:hypothetical protein
MPYKISDLDSVNTIGVNDLIPIIAVDDGTMGSNGTNRRIAAGLAANQIAGLITTVPSIVATALSTKANSSSPTFTGNVILPSTTAIGSVNNEEIGRLDGVTSNIQTQLDGKVSASNASFSGTPTFSNSSANSLTDGALHLNASTGAILIDDGGHKRISWNDDDGNLNIRSGHYKTSTNTVYAKATADTNGGAARITLNTDVLDGTITLSTAAIGTPGTTVSWANNFVLNKDYAYTDKKFGIGLSTTPAASLHINAGSLGATANSEVEICRLSTTNANGSNLIVSTKRNAAGADWTTASTRIAQRTDVTDQGYIEFNPSSVTAGLALGSGASRAIVIDSTGKVGIGKNNPSTALDVNGTVTATTFSGSFSGSITGNAPTSTLAAKASTLANGGGNGGGMTFNWSGKGGQPYWLWGGEDGANMYVYHPGNFSVNYANSANSASKSNQLQAFVNDNFTDGNHFVKAIREDGWRTRLKTCYDGGAATTNDVVVGYADRAALSPFNGTFTADNQANVNKIYVGGFGTNKGWGMIMRKASNSEVGGAILFQGSTGGTCGRIEIKANETVGYYETSDYRLKTEITPLTTALDTVCALKPVKFKWKSNLSSECGFIAHEVQEVIPNLVIGEKDAIDENGEVVPQQVEYSKFTTFLVAAIQEQQKLIDSLIEEVNNLKKTL